MLLSSLSICSAFCAPCATAQPVIWHGSADGEQWTPLEVPQTAVAVESFEDLHVMPRVGALSLWATYRKKGHGAVCRPEDFGVYGQTYLPERNTWRAINPRGGPGPRLGVHSVQEHDSLVIWGGKDPCSSGENSTGAALSLSNGTWEPLPTEGTPAFGSVRLQSVGENLVLWGSSPANDLESIGALLRKGAKSWIRMAEIKTPVPRFVTALFPSGDRLLAWGSSSEFGCMSSGALYSPAENRWEQISSLGAPEACEMPFTFSRPGELLVWGGKARRFDDKSKERREWVASGAIYSEKDRRWRQMSIDGAPVPNGDNNAREAFSAFWNGSAIFFIRFTERGCEGHRYLAGADQWAPVTAGNKLTGSPDQLGSLTTSERLPSGEHTIRRLLFERGTDNVIACETLSPPSHEAFRNVMLFPIRVNDREDLYFVGVR